jgi:hypothetical protein
MHGCGLVNVTLYMCWFANASAASTVVLLQACTAIPAAPEPRTRQ